MSEIKGKKQGLISIGALIGENVIRLSIAFFVSIWLARYLGPEEFGSFNYVISFVTIFAPVFNFGSDDIIVKYLIENKRSEMSILGSALGIKLLGTIVASTLIISLVFITIRITPNLSKEILLMIFLYTLFFSFRFLDVFYNWMQAHLLENKAAKIRTFVFLFINILKSVGIFLKMPWAFFIYISGGEIALVSILLILGFLKTKKILSIKFDKTIFKTMLKTSPIVMGSIFFEQGLSKIDQVMIGNMLGTQELGHYSAASKLINLWVFIPHSLALGAYPFLVKTMLESPSLYNKYKKILYGATLWPALLFSVIITFCSQEIVNVIYGLTYAPTGPILAILSWQTIFLFCNIVRGKVFIIENKLSIYLFLVMITFIMNIPINYLLIKRWGISGAPYGSIIAYTLSFLLLSLLSRSVRVSNMDFLQSFLAFPIQAISFIKSKYEKK